MKLTYVPILKAKLGEFTALKHLSSRSANQIIPLLDLPRAKDKDYEYHLDNLVTEVASIWNGRSIFLDTFFWAPNAQTKQGNHVFTYAHAGLEASGVFVNPIVGYDRWDDPEYQDALAALPLKQNRFYCIRFDSEALEDMSDPVYFDERIASILAGLGALSKQCAALIDLSDITQHAVNDLIPTATAAILELSQRGFATIILSGASMPPSVTTVIKTINSSGYVMRKEMLLWQTLLSEHAGLVYSDYGIRNPKTADDVIAPHINGKIRYTTDKKYFIVRGHSMQLPPKGAQNHSLAKEILNSGHYAGANFSWGDKRIHNCANGEFKGNSTDWIAIDTNHHIEAVCAEIFEFRKSIAPTEVV